MSIALMSLVWKTDLDSTSKLVLLRLADYAGDDGSRVFPAVPTVARECSLGERTVQGALRRMEEAGILVVVREADYRARRPREYRISVNILKSQVNSDTPRSMCTGAADAPVRTDTGAADAPLPRSSCTGPVQQMHPSGAGAAPNPSYEPSSEASAEPPPPPFPPCEGGAVVASLPAGWLEKEANAPAHPASLRLLATSMAELRTRMGLREQRFGNKLRPQLSRLRVQRIEQAEERLTVGECQAIVRALDALEEEFDRGPAGSPTSGRSRRWRRPKGGWGNSRRRSDDAP